MIYNFCLIELAFEVSFYFFGQYLINALIRLESPAAYVRTENDIGLFEQPLHVGILLGREGREVFVFEHIECCAQQFAAFEGSHKIL